MPKFQVDEMTVLLKMTCAKAKATYDRKGMLVIDEEMTDEIEPTHTDVSQKFLDEYVLKPLNAAEEAGRATLSLGVDKVNKLCNYLGYKEYNVFRSYWKRLSRAVPEKIGFRQFQVMCHHDDEEFVSGSWEECFFPGQNPATEDLLLVGPRTNTDLKTLVTGKMTLLVLSQWNEKELLQQAYSLIQSNGDAHWILPIWLDWDSQEIKDVFPSYPSDSVLDADHLLLAAQYLQYRAEHATDILERTEKMNQKQGFYISDSGAVFIGDVQLNGTYISSRDMNITINKTN